MKTIDISLSDDIFLMDCKKVAEQYGESDFESSIKKSRVALIKLYECAHSCGGNMAQKYRTYEKYVPVMLKRDFMYQEMIRKMGQQLDRYEKAASARKYARWTDSEDEALIEMVADGKTGIHELSTAFGRSPASISTRLTKLVGIGRISQEIVGKFVGTLNGEDVSGDVVGTLTKG